MPSRTSSRMRSKSSAVSVTTSHRSVADACHAETAFFCGRKISTLKLMLDVLRESLSGGQPVALA